MQRVMDMSSQTPMGQIGAVGRMLASQILNQNLDAVLEASTTSSIIRKVMFDFSSE
jgi:hypothetical protein